MVSTAGSIPSNRLAHSCATAFWRGGLHTWRYGFSLHSRLGFTEMLHKMIPSGAGQSGITTLASRLVDFLDSIPRNGGATPCCAHKCMHAAVKACMQEDGYKGSAANPDIMELPPGI